MFGYLLNIEFVKDKSFLQHFGKLVLEVLPGNMVAEHSDGGADGGNGNQGDLAGPFQCRVAEGVDIAKDEGNE